MKSFFSKSTLLAFGLLLATSANAVIVDEYWIDQGYGAGEGGFTITNDTNQAIYGFAVGANGADRSTYNGPLGLNWVSALTTEDGWNNGWAVDWSEAYFTVDTRSIGLFSDLFAGYNQVVIYAYIPSELVLEGAPASRGLAAGEIESGFTFVTDELASPFVTFDQNYNLLETGDTLHVATVPVPAAVWLFLSGVLGLAGIARRKV